ncbi:MAG: hypothetical protein HY859_05445 [Caulobacterales bacterium]|nr:hypothetical protein [Caulobacterales bacterium]
MASGIAEQLKSAAEAGHLVRLHARSEPGHTCGYVRTVGAEFVLLSVVSDGIWFDGFNCLRIDDLEALELDPHAAFLDAVLKARAEATPPSPIVDLDSVEGLLTSASGQLPLVTIHAGADVCYIGRVLSIEGGIVWMREIDADAVWDADPTPHRLIDITRIDFGGDYEDALHLVARAPTEPVERRGVPLRLVTSED